LLCQLAPGVKDFHYLKIPVKFLNKEKQNLCVRKNNKLSIFLSAEQNEMFVEQRGNGKVGFCQFLTKANLAI
jgi:hypothetical protein